MATNMKMFWGVVLEPGKQYAQKADTSFHLTMAAIEPSTKTPAPNKSPITSVLLESNKTKFILCNLDQQNHIQQQLDFVFVEGEDIVFSVNGDSKVHLTGYIMPDSDLDEDGVYDESDIDSEEEAMATLNAGGKKRKDVEEAKGSKKVKFGGDQAANNKQDKKDVKPILKPNQKNQNQPQQAKQLPKIKDPANLDNTDDEEDDDSDDDSDMSDGEEFGSDDLADLLDGFDQSQGSDLDEDDDEDDDDDDSDDLSDSEDEKQKSPRKPQQKANEKPQQKPKGTPKPQGKPQQQQQQNSTPKGQQQQQQQQKPFQNQNQGKKSPNSPGNKNNHFNQSGGKQKFNQNQTPGKKGGTPFNKSFGSGGKKKNWQRK
ncbi:uncharacterized protein LOC141858399 [Brevipalpus obovatus]|uniref:uncharacterized protein LOC141858399 n=1 Tax=Brevipalpus obovatus TaxID=246614 RepID=UPI003D9ED5FD